MLEAQAGRVFAPEVQALRLKFVLAFEATSRMQDHQMVLTERESAIFRSHPQIFEKVVRDLGGSLRRRDPRSLTRSWKDPQYCSGEHDLHAIWTRSAWRPWHHVNGLACANCDLFVEDPS